MANDWQSQYAPKHHPGITDFLRRNPGDEARIGSALEIEPWDGTATTSYLDIPDPISSVDGGAGLSLEQSLQEILDTQDTAGQPVGAPVGGEYGLAFRPGDINPDYRDYTDVDYLTQVDPSFPAWPTEGMGGFSVAEQTPGILQALTDRGYTTRLDPADTAAAGMPDYNIYAPGSDDPLPYALRAFMGSGNQDPDNQLLQTIVEAPNIPSNPNLPSIGGEGPSVPSQPGALSGYDPYPESALLNVLGQIPYDTASAPIIPPAYQEMYTEEVGADPLSRKANLALENLIHGGVAPTPFTAQTEQTISDILGSRGAEAPTEGEATIFRSLSDILGAGGVTPPTPLEAESQESLRALLASGGVLPSDEGRLAMQLEAARSPLDRLRAAQLAQGQATMADRGLLGQGPEQDYMARLETQLAPMYTESAQRIALEEGERADVRYREAMGHLHQQALAQRLSADQREQRARELQTDIALDRAQRQDARLLEAVKQGTALTTEQSRNIVDAVNALTGVQEMRTDAALNVLDRNIAWNQFLAEYGLERDKTMAALQQGRLEFLLPLIQEYFKATALAAEGYVSGTQE